MKIYSTWSSYITPKLIHDLRQEMPKTMKEIENELGSLKGMQTGIVIGKLKDRGMARVARKFHNAILQLNMDALNEKSEFSTDEYAWAAKEEQAKMWQEPRQRESDVQSDD